MQEADDLALITSAAREVGQIAQDLRGQPREVIDKPDGAGPVTDADLAVNARLERLLRGARPDYGWLSEESPPDAARLTARRTFVVDPIDGTRAYIGSGPDWAHSIAVVEDGQPIAGCVYLPDRALLYSATRGAGAELNGQPISATASAELNGARVLTNPGSLRAEHWRGGTPPIERHVRSALAWRFCLVAEGAFDAMITLFPAWDWDIAAGALIAAEAGVLVTDRNGAPLSLNAKTPKASGVVAAPPVLHAALTSRLTYSAKNPI